MDQKWMKTSTNVWKASTSDEYVENNVIPKAEAPVSVNETVPAADKEQEKKSDPVSYAELWKKYVPQTNENKHKKTAPVYDPDAWKKYVKPADTEKKKKTAPAYDPDAWKKYVKPKQKQTTPAYDPDAWKKYVNPADADKWKDAGKAKTTGGGYSARNGYLLNLPACNDFNLFNFAQISAPAGVKIHFKLPFPISEKGIKKIAEQVKNANGTLEAKD